MLSEIRDVLNQVIDMHQLNFELLEQLNITCKWLLQNKTEVPNREKLISLLNNADCLINEVNSGSPYIAFVSKVAKRKFTGTKTKRRVDRTRSQVLLTFRLMASSC